MRHSRSSSAADSMFNMGSGVGLFERNWMHRAGNSFVHPQSMFESPFFRDISLVARSTGFMERRDAPSRVQERGRRESLRHKLE